MPETEYPEFQFSVLYSGRKQKGEGFPVPVDSGLVIIESGLLIILILLFETVLNALALICLLPAWRP